MVEVLLHDDSASHADLASAFYDLLRLPSAKKANDIVRCFLLGKVSQLASLPQGQPERDNRVVSMVDKMDEEGFGHCTNTGACEAECPKEISLEYIRKMNWEYHRANIKG